MRAVLHNSRFAGVAVLLLALGVSTNIVLFALADAVMFRPFPFRDQGRLVIGAENRAAAMRVEVSYPNFKDWHDRSRTFDGLAAMGSTNWTLTLRARDLIAVPYRAVSYDFFDVLGTRPMLGRTFGPQDDLPGAERVVIISYGLWQREFGSDPHIIGRSVAFSERPFTIVGVMPRGLVYPVGADAWAPVVPALSDIRNPSLPDLVHARGASALLVVGRLKAGVSLSAARADLDRVIRQLGTEYRVPDVVTSELTPLVDELIGSVRIGLWALLMAVALLLLATVANVTGLNLVQLSRRQREFAVRLAIGASTRDLARQLLLESGVLVGAAVVVAILVARIALPGVLTLVSPSLPRVDEAAIDVRVILFTALLGAATMAACWIAPALTIHRGLDRALRSGGRTIASTGFSRPGRRLLVALEMAIAVVILAGAGLLYRSVSRLSHLDLGFNPQRLLAVEVGLPRSLQAGSRADSSDFYTRAIEAVATVPSVQSVAGVGTRPFKSLIGLDSSWQFEGQSSEDTNQNPWINLEVITPMYFATMGTPLIQGRTFDEGDRTASPPVVIVNEKLATWAWPGQSAIGKRIRAAGLNAGRTPPLWWTVVGVVSDLRYRDIRSSRLDVYYPFTQSYFPIGDLVIRTSASVASVAPAVRQRLRQISPDGIVDVAAMEQVVAAHQAPWRTNLLFFSFFAGLTVLLAAVGIYTMLAASVAEQSREIGVRLALGATGNRIVRDILAQGIRVAVPGSLLGVVASVALSRFMRALLFEVSPVDTVTLVGVPSILLAIAMAACAAPALRASRVDPAVCLRSE
jgi:putative ABC transport system permease protein